MSILERVRACYALLEHCRVEYTVGMNRKAYPSDVSDEAPRRQPAFIVPYLTLMREDAPQREHPRREVFNGTQRVPGWIVRAGASWRIMPHDLPPYGSPVGAVYQQMQRWIVAGVFEAMVDDLRVLLRLANAREAQPTAVIFDSRTLQSTPESGGRAGYDGAKRKKGSKVHMAVDTLGYLLGLHITAANEQGPRGNPS